MPLFHAQGNV